MLEKQKHNIVEDYMQDILDKMDFLSKLVNGNRHINGDENTNKIFVHINHVTRSLDNHQKKIKELSGMEVLIDELIAMERKKHEEQSVKR